MKHTTIYQKYNDKVSPLAQLCAVIVMYNAWTSCHFPVLYQLCSVPLPYVRKSFVVPEVWR